jgi:hypothetical protein
MALVRLALEVQSDRELAPHPRQDVLTGEVSRGVVLFWLAPHLPPRWRFGFVEGAERSRPPTFLGGLRSGALEKPTLLGVPWRTSTAYFAGRVRREGMPWRAWASHKANAGDDLDWPSGVNVSVGRSLHNLWGYQPPSAKVLTNRGRLIMT